MAVQGMTRAGRGGVLLVEGAPGAGKSRLMREAPAIAESLPLRVLSGAGERGREVVPFGVLLRSTVAELTEIGAHSLQRVAG
ncbi:hypothetical protein [Actinomadura monticuli]|uniref:Orc1-like AAA ATPase domain-containing protein n=1 Tax=Actinomadura monticuli TaxID=3097367 RepID=A0ABV4QJ27_9ACTN